MNALETPTTTLVAQEAVASIALASRRVVLADRVVPGTVVVENGLIVAIE
jgi:hypothetical protein